MTCQRDWRVALQCITLHYMPRAERLLCICCDTAWTADFQFPYRGGRWTGACSQDEVLAEAAFVLTMHSSYLCYYKAAKGCWTI